MRNDFLKILSLILISAAIALSPSFSVGRLADGRTIEIRLEDILILIFTAIFIFDIFILRQGKDSKKTEEQAIDINKENINSGIKRLKESSLFFPIIFWLGIGFISVLVNWIFGQLDFWRGFFYFLKEIEFFIFYFYFFYYLGNINLNKILVKSWIVLAGLNVVYLIYQLVMKATPLKYGEYGTGAIGEWGVFPSGSFFLLLFIFLFSLFLYYFSNFNLPPIKKWFLYFVILGLILGIFGSASKTIFLAFIFALAFLFVLWFFSGEETLKRKIILITLTLIISLGFFLIVLERAPVSKRIITEMSSPTKFTYNFERERVKIVDENIQKTKEKMKSKSYYFFIGQGIGAVGEVHSQYLRNFIETGIAGSLVFLFLIFAIIKNSWIGIVKSRDRFAKGLSAGLLISTLAMLFCSLATEPFIVVKTSEVYWVFAAMTISSLQVFLNNHKG